MIRVRPLLRFARVSAPPGMTVTLSSVSPVPPVEGQVFVRVARLAMRSVVFTPSISVEAVSGQSLAPARMTASSRMGAPIVAPGAVTIAASRIVAVSRITLPGIDNGATIVRPQRLVTRASVGAAGVAPGPITLAAGRIVAAIDTGAPQVLAGAVTVATARMVAIAGFGRPMVAPGAVAVTVVGVQAVVRAGAPTVAVAVAPAPTPAPNYLASVGTAPYAAYGSQRTVSGYFGPLFQLRRTSDDAVQDFACATSSDYPDYAAIVAWAGSPDVRVVRWYDQAGNGRHMDAVSQAMEPWLLTATPQDGVIPLVFDHTDMRMSVGGLSLDLLNYAAFVVENRETLQRDSSTLEFSNEAATMAYHGFTGWLRSSAAGPVFQSGQWNPPRMRVLGWSPVIASPTTDIDIYGFASKTATANRSRRQWNSALPAQSAQRLTIGRNTVGDSNQMRARISAVALYPASLSVADGDAVFASLRTAFKVMPNPTWAYVVRHIGDSIAEGSTTRKLRSMSSWLRDSLTKNALVFNQGIGGDTMGSGYNARVSRYGGTNNVFAGVQSVDFIQYGTNDLAGGAGAAAGMAPALNTKLTDFVAYLKGQGKKVVACTILPRSDGNWQANPDYESQRLAYNDLVRANTAGADYVLDLAAHTVMGDTANTADTAIYSDLIHPSSLGQRYLAGAPSGTYANTHTYYYALQEVLRTATGNPAYVL